MSHTSLKHWSQGKARVSVNVATDNKSRRFNSIRKGEKFIKINPGPHRRPYTLIWFGEIADEVDKFVHQMNNK